MIAIAKKEMSIMLKLVDKYTKPLDTASRETKRSQKEMMSSFQRMEGVVKKVGLAIGAAFAVHKLKEFGGEAIRAYNIQAKSELQLQKLVEGNKTMTKGATDRFKAYAGQLQNVGVVGDEVSMQGMAQLASFGLQEDSIKKLTPALLDMAVRQKGVNVTQEDMISMGNLLGKAMTGQTKALSRQGVVMTDAQAKILKFGNEQQRAAMMAKILGSNFGEQNKALRQTSEGGVQALKNSWGDLMEIIGKPLSSGLGWLANEMSQYMPGIQSFVQQYADDITKYVIDHKQDIKDIGTGFMSAAKMVGDAVNTMMPALTMTAKAITDISKAIDMLNSKKLQFGDKFFGTGNTLIGLNGGTKEGRTRIANAQATGKNTLLGTGGTFLGNPALQGIASSNSRANTAPYKPAGARQFVASNQGSTTNHTNVTVNVQGVVDNKLVDQIGQKIEQRVTNAINKSPKPMLGGI